MQRLYREPTKEVSPTLRANAGDNQVGVIHVGKCLNSWDVQSKHIQPVDGIAESLYSGECRYGGGESYILWVDGLKSK